MPNHHYNRGDRVSCWMAHDGLAGTIVPDEVVAVTTTSIVTEMHGTFRRDVIQPDGHGVRPTPWGHVHLMPAAP